MNLTHLIWVLLNTLGGLSVFLIGMHIMTEGLKHSATTTLQSIINRAVDKRVKAGILGTSVGFLAHSSAGTVMLVGFVHAGLITLHQAVPVILGINLGTTLSMQLFSFKLADYCLAALFIGTLVYAVFQHTKFSHLGKGIMGFGLLFLGMSIMSDTVTPYREQLAPALSLIDGSNVTGMIRGIILATAVTAVIQSSGATIGITFALLSAGAITDLKGAFPVIIGANTGTCVTALLASIGTTVEAKRTALTHLLFNILSTLAAAFMAPLYYRWMPLITTDIVHQAANANTFKMLISAAVLLPVTPWLARAVIGMTPVKKKCRPGTYLNQGDLQKPEKAVVQCIRELQRAALICDESMRLAGAGIEKGHHRYQRISAKNEVALNDIKKHMNTYLSQLTQRYLSRRQAIMIEHLDRCMADIERIGDHIEEINTITRRRQKMAGREFHDVLAALTLDLFHSGQEILERVIHSLDPVQQDFQETAKHIIEARDRYVEVSLETKRMFTDYMERKQASPIAGMIFYEYTSAIDRIVRHAKSIALAEQQPYFWIKQKKMDRIVSDKPKFAEPGGIQGHDFLEEHQREEYL